jgi:hypothetical protein
MTDTCPVCGATRTEIETDGHRLQRGGVCSEACTCIPECFSLAEHRAMIEADEQRLVAAGEDAPPAHRRLCCHADQDGRGMHWLEPGEVCPGVEESPLHGASAKIADAVDALTADRCPRCRQVLDDEHTELSCAVEIVVTWLGDHDQEDLAAAVAIATDQTSARICSARSSSEPDQPGPLERCVECDEQYCDRLNDLDEPVHEDCS